MDTLKDKLTTTLILQGPNWALPFHIHDDASQKAIGAALGLIDEKLPYAIYFISKNLSKAELNYTVTEKELLVVVHSLKKFRNYITSYQTFLHTDHVAIKYLMNKPNVNSEIIRWLLLLQQFDLTIVDNPGKENVVADFLSISTLPAGEEGMVDDQLLYEHLFTIPVLSPWFDICIVTTEFVLQREKQDCEEECPLHLDWGQPLQTRPRSNSEKDVKRYTSQFDRFQRMGKPTPRDEIHLQAQVTFKPFDKWGMDFIGPIDPPSKQEQYIIVCTDYLTKWAKTKEINAATEEKVVEFLRENVFYKFGYPR
eukprot:PITA_06733